MAIQIGQLREENVRLRYNKELAIEQARTWKSAVVSKIYVKSVIMVTPDDTELSGKSVSKKMTENFLQAPWVTLGDLPWVLGHFPRAR